MYNWINVPIDVPTSVLNVHVEQHVAGNISVNSALTAWLACVCDHVNNFGRDRMKREGGMGRN